MATAPEIEAPQNHAAFLDHVKANPALVLTGNASLDKLVEAISAEYRQSENPDMSIATVRDRIKADAYAITRLKTAIDDAGKAMTEKWREQTAKVNSARNVVKERLAELSSTIRLPVTQWEQAEEARKSEADAIIADLKDSALVRHGETADQVQDRLDRIRGINLNPEILKARTDMATDLRDDCVKALTEAVQALRHTEQQAAELEQLRRERAEAEQREQQRIAAEREKAEKEAREKAEQERLEREREHLAAVAREQARIDAERAAQAEIDAANERARLAEQEAQAERDRIAREQAERDARIKAEQDEAERRRKDMEHRKQVDDEAVEALSGITGVSARAAREIVLKVAAGTIPHVSIAY